jgi:hypothetical protein
MADYVIYPSDPKKEKVIRGLYMYMEGMREIYLQQPQYFQTLLNKIKSTGKTGVVVTNFLSHYAICKSLFNSKLAALCPEKPAGTDFSSSIALELMNYNGEIQYQPLMSLYYNNCVNFALNDIDLGLGMRLALGNDAPAEGSPNGQANGNSDLIPCWHFKKNGQIQLELISEQQAKNSKIPLFIMNPGLIKNGTSPYVSPEGYVFTMVDVNDGDGGIYVPTIVNGGCNTGGSSGTSGPSGSTGTSGGNNNNNVNQTPQPGNLFLEGVNLGYHYDASGNSELFLSQMINDDDNTQVTYFKLLDIQPNYINCICYKPVGTVLLILNYPAAPVNTHAFLLYEHDWYAGKKEMSYTSFPHSLNNYSQQTKKVAYKASFANEIYNFQYYFISTYFSTPNTNVNFPYGINHASVTRY